MTHQITYSDPLKKRGKFADVHSADLNYLLSYDIDLTIEYLQKIKWQAEMKNQIVCLSMDYDHLEFLYYEKLPVNQEREEDIIGS
jgi:hypothetical protein